MQWNMKSLMWGCSVWDKCTSFAAKKRYTQQHIHVYLFTYRKVSGKYTQLLIGLNFEWLTMRWLVGRNGIRRDFQL